MAPLNWEKCLQESRVSRMSSDTKAREPARMAVNEVGEDVRYCRATVCPAGIIFWPFSITLHTRVHFFRVLDRLGAFRLISV